MAVSRIVQAKPRVRRRPLRQHLLESPVGDCVRGHPPRGVGETAAIQSGGHIGGLRTPEHLRKSIEQGASTTALLAGRRWWTGFPAGTSTTVRRSRWSTSAAWDHSKAWQDTLSIRRMPSVSGRWRRGCRQRRYNPEGPLALNGRAGFACAVGWRRSGLCRCRASERCAHALIARGGDNLPTHNRTEAASLANPRSATDASLTSPWSAKHQIQGTSQSPVPNFRSIPATAENTTIRAP